MEKKYTRMDHDSDICIRASPQAASKKYSGVTYDGKKEVRLSPKIIHDRIPEIKTFYETYPRYYALHILCCR